jgi:c-di-GMP phosphodiesterase
MNQPSSPVLGQVALGYSPVFDAKRQLQALRLSILPAQAGARPDMAALVAALQQGLGEDAEALWLNVAGEGPLADLISAMPPPHMAVEVPAFMACDAQYSSALQVLHAAGSQLLIKGRPPSVVPKEVLACFSRCIVASDEDLRGPANPEALPLRRLPFVQSAVHSAADLQLAFERGAAAVQGWPLQRNPAAAAGKKGMPPGAKAIVELMAGVDREAPSEQLEAVLKQDANLAFRLLRYLNSPAFGLRVEISSFRHALMMLGYARLKRWLALLLVQSSSEPDARPLMFAALRRGLMMEALLGPQAEEQMRSELFICGLFSLLEPQLGQPLPELLRSVPAPPAVAEALVDNEGPLWPYLELVLAVEQEAGIDIVQHASALLLPLAQVNQALLHALRVARQLQ